MKKLAEPYTFNGRDSIRNVLSNNAVGGYDRSYVGVFEGFIYIFTFSENVRIEKDGSNLFDVVYQFSFDENLHGMGYYPFGNICAETTYSIYEFSNGKAPITVYQSGQDNPLVSISLDFYGSKPTEVTTSPMNGYAHIDLSDSFYAAPLPESFTRFRSTAIFF